MPTAADDRPASVTPPTCEVRDWQVFRNGHHKAGEFYSPADVQQIAANHRTLTGRLTPTAGLGHDLKQRLAKSLGLPNCGVLPEPDDVRADDQGNLYLTVRNVPTWLGGMINAGRYPAGSVELKRDVSDPADPAKKLPGSVLTAVAFLGEEEPAVKGCPPPRAVFADGTPVPPNHDPLPVPADVARPADPPNQPESRLAAARLCFSEGAAVNRDEINQQLIAAGLDPAAVQALSDDEAKAAAGFAAKFGASIGKKFAADNPPAPKPVAQLSAADEDKTKADFAAFAKQCFADAVAPLTQRMGAMEQAISDQQKAVSGQMSTLSAFDKTFHDGRKKQVADAVEAAFAAKKIDPAEKARLLAEGEAVATRSTFAAGDNGELAGWLAKLAKLPVHPFARHSIPDAAGDAKRDALPATAAGVIRHLELDSGRAAANLAKRVAA